MKRLLTVMVLCVFASFAHADEQNAIQSPQGVEICKEPLSDNRKAFGDRINQRTPEKQKTFDVEQLSSLVQRCQHFLSDDQFIRAANAYADFAERVPSSDDNLERIERAEQSAVNYPITQQSCQLYYRNLMALTPNLPDINQRQ